MKFFKVKYYLFYSLFIVLVNYNYSQEKKIEGLLFLGDFRFRAEQDWDSKKSDGSYREDRTRLRYRFRFGVKYDYNDWAQVGGRIRTGNLQDQQGPHVTIGGNSGEFGLTQVGFEKIYFKAKHKFISGWIGKNSFPFEKQNELFWNDNVFLEGVAFSLSNFSKKKFLKTTKINLGHFIFNSEGGNLDQDGFMQGIQLVEGFKKATFYGGFFYLNNVPNIPDGKGLFEIEYSIVNLGGVVNLGIKDKFRIGVDGYLNLSDNNNLSENIKDDTAGIVYSLGYGSLKKDKDWSVNLTYAYLEKIAVVDYFAQNDWARWDYSSSNASGSRLTNFKGLELKVGYRINEKMNFIFRAYNIRELKALGDVKETGSRARLDFNFKF